MKASKKPVGRPKKDLSVKFADVLPMWKATVYMGSFKTMLESPGKAISTMQRLHKVRAIMRLDDPEEFCIYDKFIIRLNGNELRITPREVPDTNNFYTADGRKINYDEVEASFNEAQRMQERLRKEQGLEKPAGQILQEMYSPKPPPPDDHPEEALDNLEIEK